MLEYILMESGTVYEVYKQEMFKLPVLEMRRGKSLKRQYQWTPREAKSFEDLKYYTNIHTVDLLYLNQDCVCLYPMINHF